MVRYRYMDFGGKTHFQQLHERWTKRHQDASKNLWEKHADALDWFKDRTKHIAVGSLSGLMLLTAPHLQAMPKPNTHLAAVSSTQSLDKRIFLASDLKELIPEQVRPLTVGEEEKIAGVLTRDTGIKVAAEIDGKRLNRSYGYIGAEQHLARYPGDSLSTHFSTQDEAQKYYSSGMAPGLGAWGYFARSGEEFTKKDADREKYYIAVQTFLSPDFNSRVAEYRDFYKFRKMLLVNPQNGKAIVTVIGDAGPAQWTGKSLGGSPEVMKHLERVDGKAKGPVLYFFIDDTDDTIPLGPVEMNTDLAALPN